MVCTLSTLHRETPFREVAMPWVETDSMNERSKFVQDAVSDRFTMAEVCARYGVSRPTGVQMDCALRRGRPAGARGPRSGTAHVPAHVPAYARHIASLVGMRLDREHERRCVRSVPVGIVPPLEPPVARPTRRAIESAGTPPPVCRRSRGSAIAPSTRPTPIEFPSVKRRPASSPNVLFLGLP